jgi:hypothetical protein
VIQDKNKEIVGSLGYQWSMLIVDRVDDEEGFFSVGKGHVLIDGS